MKAVIRFPGTNIPFEMRNADLFREWFFFYRYSAKRYLEIKLSMFEIKRFHKHQILFSPKTHPIAAERL